MAESAKEGDTEVAESSLRMLLAFKRSTRLDSRPATPQGLQHQVHPGIVGKGTDHCNMQSSLQAVLAGQMFA